MDLIHIPRSLAATLLVITCLCMGCSGPEPKAASPSAPGRPNDAAELADRSRIESQQLHEGSDTLRIGFVVTDHQRRQLQEDQKKLDPDADGWASESFAERTQNYWHQVAEWTSNREAMTAQQLADWISPQFTCTPLVPEPCPVVFQQGPITVRRWDGETGVALESLSGSDAYSKALESLCQGYFDRSTIDTHFKTTQVGIDGGRANTTVHMEMSGSTPHGRRQRTATWECIWDVRDVNRPRLASICVADFEQVDSHTPSGTWYSDCTLAVLGDQPAFQEQLRHGLDHWLRQVERVHRIDVYSRYGFAVGDVNSDGLDDVYVCQPGGVPNRLFVQDPDGTATDRAREANVDWLDHTSSALLVDLDNDGDQDLVGATAAGIVFAENDGRGTFQLRHQARLVDHDPHSLSAADFDSDGDLDIYVCVEFASGASKSQDRGLFVYHDANDGGRNVLLRNDIEGSAERSWSWADVTADVGLDVDNRRHSLAAAWEDYDNDGDLDLYVANDYGRNCLYENQNGRFRNVAAERGVVDFGSGMSVSWADVDHDGWMDLYVGNMFSSAGSRVTRQPAFQPGSNEATRRIYSRFAKGNSLFLNQHGSRFHEAGAQAAVEMARWAWASLLVDLNNDSWDDIVVANGYITGEDTGDL